MLLQKCSFVSSRVGLLFHRGDFVGLVGRAHPPAQPRSLEGDPDRRLAVVFARPDHVAKSKAVASQLEW